MREEAKGGDLLTVRLNPAASIRKKRWRGRLTREGYTITAFTSPDGNTWTPAGSTEADFGKNCHIGLYLAGGKGKTASATFRYVRVNP